MREPTIYKPILCLADVGPHPRITAHGFRFNNGKVKAKILTLMGVSCDQGIYGTVSLEAALRVAVACPHGTVNFTGESVFYAHSFQRSTVTLQILGMNVYLEDCERSCETCNRKITAHLILVQLFRSFWNHNMDGDSKMAGLSTRMKTYQTSLTLI